LDRAGFLDKIIASATNIYEGRLGLDTDGGEREGRINYQSGLTLALDVFKKIRSQSVKDLDIVILAEYTFLSQELQFCASQDTKAITSLSKAIHEFDEAFLALNVLQHPEIYKSMEKAISHRTEFRYRTMPKDAFHVACAGHKTRLDNILKSPGINLLEKELLKQRYANMITAQLVYLEKQKKIIILDK
jgi:hypothetical protein